MQKALAILALVSATTAVPLGAVCEWRCARGEAGSRVLTVASEPACHHGASASEEPTAWDSALLRIAGHVVLANDDRCGDHDQFPALTESRRSLTSVTSLALLGRPTVVVTLDPARLAARPSIPPQDTSPPPAGISILRI